MMTLARAVSLTGLAPGAEYPWAGGTRSAIDWAVRIGATSIQLDVTAHGVRPRELDGAARRDLLAVLRRAGAECAGLDAFIPPTHFTDGAHADRAVSALLQAVELAADLSHLAGVRLAVSTTLPEKAPADIVSRLALAADHHGVQLADHAWPPRESRGGLVPGIDPAAAIAGGGDLAQTVVRLTAPPGAARLSDVSGAGRCEPGKGRLDLMAYEVALVTVGFRGPLVLDLRGLARQEAIATAMVKA